MFESKTMRVMAGIWLVIMLVALAYSYVGH